MTNESNQDTGRKLVDRIRFVRISNKGSFGTGQEIDVETLRREKCKYKIVRGEKQKTEYFGRLTEIRVRGHDPGVEVTLENTSEDKEGFYGQLYIREENDLGVYVPQIVSVE